MIGWLILIGSVLVVTSVAVALERLVDWIICRWRAAVWKKLK